MPAQKSDPPEKSGLGSIITADLNQPTSRVLTWDGLSSNFVFSQPAIYFATERDFLHGSSDSVQYSTNWSTFHSERTFNIRSTLADNVSIDGMVIFATMEGVKYSISHQSQTVFIYTQDGDEIYNGEGMVAMETRFIQGFPETETVYTDNKYSIRINHDTGAVTWTPITVQRE